MKRAIKGNGKEIKLEEEFLRSLSTGSGVIASVGHDGSKLLQSKSAIACALAVGDTDKNKNDSLDSRESSSFVRGHHRQSYEVSARRDKYKKDSGHRFNRSSSIDCNERRSFRQSSHSSERKMKATVSPHRRYSSPKSKVKVKTVISNADRSEKYHSRFVERSRGSPTKRRNVSPKRYMDSWSRDRRAPGSHIMPVAMNDSLEEEILRVNLLSDPLKDDDCVKNVVNRDLIDRMDEVEHRRDHVLSIRESVPIELDYKCDIMMQNIKLAEKSRADLAQVNMSSKRSSNLSPTDLIQDLHSSVHSVREKSIVHDVETPPAISELKKRSRNKSSSDFSDFEEFSKSLAASSVDYSTKITHSNSASEYGRELKGTNSAESNFMIDEAYQISAINTIAVPFDQCNAAVAPTVCSGLIDENSGNRQSSPSLHNKHIRGVRSEKSKSKSRSSGRDSFEKRSRSNSQSTGSRSKRSRARSCSQSPRRRLSDCHSKSNCRQHGWGVKQKLATARHQRSCTDGNQIKRYSRVAKDGRHPAYTNIVGHNSHKYSHDNTKTDVNLDCGFDRAISSRSLESDRTKQDDNKCGNAHFAHCNNACTKLDDNSEHNNRCFNLYNDSRHCSRNSTVYWPKRPSDYKVRSDSSLSDSGRSTSVVMCVSSNESSSTPAATAVWDFNIASPTPVLCSTIIAAEFADITTVDFYADGYASDANRTVAGIVDSVSDLAATALTVLDKAVTNDECTGSTDDHSPENSLIKITGTEICSPWSNTAVLQLIDDANIYDNNMSVDSERKCDDVMSVVQISDVCKTSSSSLPLLNTSDPTGTDSTTQITNQISADIEVFDMSTDKQPHLDVCDRKPANNFLPNDDCSLASTESTILPELKVNINFIDENRGNDSELDPNGESNEIFQDPFACQPTKDDSEIEKHDDPVSREEAIIADTDKAVTIDVVEQLFHQQQSLESISSSLPGTPSCNGADFLSTASDVQAGIPSIVPDPDPSDDISCVWEAVPNVASARVDKTDAAVAKSCCESPATLLAVSRVGEDASPLKILTSTQAAKPCRRGRPAKKRVQNEVKCEATDLVHGPVTRSRSTQPRKPVEMESGGSEKKKGKRGKKTGDIDVQHGMPWPNANLLGSGYRRASGSETKAAQFGGNINRDMLHEVFKAVTKPIQLSKPAAAVTSLAGKTTDANSTTCTAPVTIDSTSPTVPIKMKSRWLKWSEQESNPDEAATGKVAMVVSSPIGTFPAQGGSIDKCEDTNGDSMGSTTVVKSCSDSKVADETMPCFESIIENVYVSERDIKKSQKEARRMVCDCTLPSVEDLEAGARACGEDCLNRMLMIECGSRCSCGDQCTNRLFQKRQYAKSKCFKTESKGWGLQAEEDMQPGTFVMEYIGEVVDYEEFKCRTKRYARDGVTHQYFMSLCGYEIIDSTKRGNMSRLINHSCDPNSETQKWTVNGELRIGFFTTRPIKCGEEITINYQFENYGEMMKCFCGAANCRGTIGYESALKASSSQSSLKSALPITSKTKRNALFNDILLSDEIEKMMSLNGLHRKDHVLEFNRLMLRAETSEHRITLLRVLQETKEPACLRLFLDYHGLPLLWSWMVDSQSADDDFKTQTLKTLALLPISNITILRDSKILSVVERWSKEASMSELIAVSKSNPEMKEEKRELKSSRDITAEREKEKHMHPKKRRRYYYASDDEDQTTINCDNSTGWKSADVLRTDASAVDESLSITNAAVNRKDATQNEPLKDNAKLKEVVNNSLINRTECEATPNNGNFLCASSVADSAVNTESGEAKKNLTDIGERVTGSGVKKPVVIDSKLIQSLFNALTVPSSKRTTSSVVNQPLKDSTTDDKLLKVLTKDNSDRITPGDELITDDNLKLPAASLLSDATVIKPEKDHTDKGCEESLKTSQGGSCKEFAINLLAGWKSLKELYKIPKKIVEERKRTEQELEKQSQVEAEVKPIVAGDTFSGWERVDKKRRFDDIDKTKPASSVSAASPFTPTAVRPSTPTTTTVKQFTAIATSRSLTSVTSTEWVSKRERRQMFENDMKRFEETRSKILTIDELKALKQMPEKSSPDFGLAASPQLPKDFEESQDNSGNISGPHAVSTLVYPQIVPDLSGSTGQLSLTDVRTDLYPSSLIRVRRKIKSTSGVDDGSNASGTSSYSSDAVSAADFLCKYSQGHSSTCLTNPEYKNQHVAVNKSVLIQPPTVFNVESTNPTSDHTFKINSISSYPSLQLNSNISQSGPSHLLNIQSTASVVHPQLTSSLPLDVQRSLNPFHVLPPQQLQSPIPTLNSRHPLNVYPPPPVDVFPALLPSPITQMGPRNLVNSYPPVIIPTQRLISPNSQLNTRHLYPNIGVSLQVPQSPVPQLESCQPVHMYPSGGVPQPLLHTGLQPSIAQGYYPQTYTKQAEYSPAIVAGSNNILYESPRPESVTSSLSYVQQNDQSESIASSSRDPPPPPPPSALKETRLPPNWKKAKDANGTTYYYHTITKQTQWNAPHWEGSSVSEHSRQSDDDVDKMKATTIMAAADTSSEEVARKMKEAFRSKISKHIVSYLNPYRKADCKQGHIVDQEDFKHLARKITYAVMKKELKHCRHLEDLEVNENVKGKAFSFVNKYMSKFGSIYKPTGSP